VQQSASGLCDVGCLTLSLVIDKALTYLSTVGSYLFARISADGEDSRFKNIRGSPPKFFGVFMIQATWVSLCLMPVLAVNALPASTFAALGIVVSITDIIGILLYVGGLSFEVAADRQKSAWVQEKKEKEHDEDFLTRGLWSKSRHPNYFGESTLWTGIAAMAAGVLASNAGTAGMGVGAGLAGKAAALLAAGISPAFVTFLLLKVSGVPLSENKYDKKYGDREDYKKWKRETPMFIPKL
jgi:steroid 5-alpha reductase family enzyme